MLNEMVPVDGGETSTCGLAEAIKMVTTPSSRLHLVHVINKFVLDYTYSSAEHATVLIDSMRENVKTFLAEAAAETKAFVARPQAELLETIGGQAAELIARHAKKVRADVIVMGTHRRRHDCSSSAIPQESCSFLTRARFTCE